MCSLSPWRELMAMPSSESPPTLGVEAEQRAAKDWFCVLPSLQLRKCSPIAIQIRCNKPPGNVTPHDMSFPLWYVTPRSL